MASKPLSQKIRQFGSAAGLSLAMGLAGCSGASQTAADTQSAGQAPADYRPAVVATTGVLCDLTKQVAQDTIELTCLLQPGQDPHTYAPSPSDRKAIEDADLILYGGYGLEPEVVRLLEATRPDVPKVAVFEEAVPQPLLTQEHDHAHEGEIAAAEHDHEQETAQAEEHDPEETGAHTEDTVVEADADLEPDPHVWHNAENGIAIATVIQNELAAIAPGQADQYRQNAAALSSQLTQIHDWIPAQVATIPASARKLVTTHDSLRYYAEAYGFTVKGALSGLSTEEKPSATRLTEMVELVKAAQVPAIFAEHTTNPQLIQTVAKDANVTVAEQPLRIEGPSGPDTAAENYQQMLVLNTCTIVNALGGQCQQPEEWTAQ